MGLSFYKIVMLRKAYKILMRKSEGKITQMEG
jgi:hypothetical protein